MTCHKVDGPRPTFWALCNHWMTSRNRTLWSISPLSILCTALWKSPWSTVEVLSEVYPKSKFSVEFSKGLKTCHPSYNLQDFFQNKHSNLPKQTNISQWISLLLISSFEYHNKVCVTVSNQHSNRWDESKIFYHQTTFFYSEIRIFSKKAHCLNFSSCVWTFVLL